MLKLTTWSEEWQMMFNATKCKVMHIGKKRVHGQYFMNNHQLEEVKEEKDLGILISRDLKALNSASWHTIKHLGFCA